MMDKGGHKEERDDVEVEQYSDCGWNLKNIPVMAIKDMERILHVALHITFGRCAARCSKFSKSENEEISSAQEMMPSKEGSA